MISRLILATAFAACAAGATLDGRVVEDHSNMPLASAEIRILRLNGRAVLADLETDAEGRFHAQDLLEGEYRIEFFKALHVNAALRVRVGASSPPLTVRLVRCGVVAGRVVDGDGHPVRGAYVWMMVKPPGAAVFKHWGNPSQVDERGQYRIFNLPPGQYAVAASYSGSAASTGSGILFHPNNTQPGIFTVSGGEEYSGTDFAILPSARYRIAGTVAPPKPGTRVSLTLVPADQPGLATARVMADAHGAFHFDGIAAGSYHVLASGPVEGYGGLSVMLGAERIFGRTQVQVAGQDVEGLSITLRAGRPASFVLRSAPGGPDASCPATALLSVSPVEAWGAFMNESVPLALGKETAIKGLAPGRYEISLSQLGEACYAATRGMTVDFATPDESGPIAVQVAPAGSIRGRLLAPSGRPADFLVVLLSSDADDSPARIVYPDAEGAFAFAPLRPGRYRIAARPVGSGLGARWVGDLARMIELDIPGGVPTDLELPVPAGGEK